MRAGNIILNIVTAVLLFAAAVLVYYFLFVRKPAPRMIRKPPEVVQVEYSTMLDSVERLRTALAGEYEKAKGKQAKAAVIEKGRKSFMDALEQLLIPYWYGTRWEFHGTTMKPQQGAIACGYFVNTVMIHAGVKLDRVKMSTCASETMIRALTQRKHIQVYSRKSFDEFAESIRKQGEGLYLTGLDYHTGFLFNRNGELYFIHSTVPGVMRETASQSSQLYYSSYRVTGCLTDDDKFILKWLKGERF